MFFDQATFDVSSLFAHLDTDSFHLAATGHLQFAMGLAFKGDLFGLGYAQPPFLAVAFSQMGQQVHFLIVGDGGVRRGDLDSRFIKLHQQPVHRDTDVCSELFDCYIRHLFNPRSV